MAVAMQTDDFPYLPSGPEEVNKMIKEYGDLFSDSQCKVCSAVLNSESQKLTHYQSKKHGNKVRRYLSSKGEKEPAVKKFKPMPSATDCNNGDTDRSKACKVCNMTFSSPVEADSHYNGKVHAKNLRLKSVDGQTLVGGKISPSTQSKKTKASDDSSGAAGGTESRDRFCSICQATFNNPLMAQQHYVGKKHRKQMTKMKLMETYGPSTAPASSSQTQRKLTSVSIASTLKGYPCTVCSIELNSVAQYQSHISGAKHKNQVKKGSNPPGNANTANQSFEGDVQFADGDNQFATAGNEYPPPDDMQFATADDQYGAGDDQYPAGDNQYPAGDNQYAPEDTEYSEEYQFT